MAQNNNLRIVIADDHPVFRHGLRQIIEAEPGFDVVGEAGDGQSALQLIQTLDPAIAILDVGMPELDGLSVVNQLWKRLQLSESSSSRCTGRKIFSNKRLKRE